MSEQSDHEWIDAQFPPGDGPTEHESRLRGLASLLTPPASGRYEYGRDDQMAVQWAVAEIDMIRSEAAKDRASYDARMREGVAEIDRLRARIAELEAGASLVHPPQFERELATYRKYWPTKLAYHAGKWVAIRDEALVGWYKTEEDAFAAGAEEWGDLPFLVKQITAIEAVHRLPG